MIQKMLNRISRKICRVWSKRVSRFKAVEIQTYITRLHFVLAHEFHIYKDSVNLYLDAFAIFGFHTNLSRKCDHAGFHFSVVLLGLNLIFDFYDTRHWDDENDCPEIIE